MADHKPSAVIWVFVKFFREERYADEFVRGSLYLNTLEYFRKTDQAYEDGRRDSAEAIAKWFQPNDVVMTIKARGFGKVVLTEKDLAAPVSMSYSYHDSLHLLCLYAVYTNGFSSTDGKFHNLSAEQLAEIKQQLKIDERCLAFGEHAVLIPAVPFLSRLRDGLSSQGYTFKWKLVEYYDDAIFHGEIPEPDIPFRKQKRFSYQHEFRVCVRPRAPAHGAIRIEIGELSQIAKKVKSSRLLLDWLVLESGMAPDGA